MRNKYYFDFDFVSTKSIIDSYSLKRIYPKDEPAEVFGFDPVLLSDALKAFKGENAVKIEYRGVLKPLIIKSDTAKALVLPVRLPQ